MSQSLVVVNHIVCCAPNIPIEFITPRRRRTATRSRPTGN